MHIQQCTGWMVFILRIEIGSSAFDGQRLVSVTEVVLLVVVGVLV